MSKTINVGDEVALNLDYLLIVQSGKANGLVLNPKEYEKTATIKSIDKYEQYPYRTTSSLGGTHRFAREELIKIQS